MADARSAACSVHERWGLPPAFLDVLVMSCESWTVFPLIGSSDPR